MILWIECTVFLITWCCQSSRTADRSKITSNTWLARWHWLLARSLDGSIAWNLSSPSWGFFLTAAWAPSQHGSCIQKEPFQVWVSQEGGNYSSNPLKAWAGKSLNVSPTVFHWSKQSQDQPEGEVVVDMLHFLMWRVACTSWRGRIAGRHLWRRATTEISWKLS